MKARGDLGKKERSGKSGSKDSFSDFQAKTNDAWDDGEDDVIRLCARRNANQSLKQNNSSTASNTSAKVSLNSRRFLSHDPGCHIKNNATNRNFSEQPPLTAAHARQTTAPQTRQQFGTKSSVQSLVPSNSHEHDEIKLEKFSSLLQIPTVDLEKLKKHSWSGIPSRYRPLVWKLLSGYLPATVDRQESMLERKRREYYNFLEQYYSTRHQEIHQETHRQIQIDVPRMSPTVQLFQQEAVQEVAINFNRILIENLSTFNLRAEMFERILYIWAIRHPASGYVQGMNDLVTPFFVVFLAEYLDKDSSVETFDVSSLPDASLQKLEADCYWCFSKLLDGIQDNYTFAQPGIQTRINQLKELIGRIDGRLHHHLEKHRVEYLQFTFRWMNNLLMRELPLRCIIRLWDTYLSEPDGFALFHLYVCAAFLTKFSAELQKEKDFHGLMLLLQNFPTQHWKDEEMKLILADAYRLKFSFADAPKHFVKESAQFAQGPR